jgi:hypothetical protein
MNTFVFETPERKQNASGESYFHVRITPEYSISHDLEWSSDTGLKPSITIQKQIGQLRSVILTQLQTTKSLFRNPPTLESLEAITPTWGIVIQRDESLQWSTANVWSYDATEMKKQNAIVRLVLCGIEISRSYIRPVWTLHVIQTLPDSSEDGVIDFDFGGEETKSVASVDMDDIGGIEEEGSGVFELHNPDERKHAMKEHIRGLLAKVAEARHAADDAIDRFYAEFDLSENESDFSDDE